MSNTATKEMLDCIYGKQVEFTYSDKIIKVYEMVKEEVLNTLNNSSLPEGSKIVFNDFSRVVSNESAVLMSPANLVLSIGEKDGHQAFINVMVNQLKATLKRAASSAGTNIRFNYTIDIIQDNREGSEDKGKQFVVLVYGYSYEAETIECGNCKTSFVKTREWSKFCSDKCRQAAFRNKAMSFDEIIDTIKEEESSIK